MAFKITPGNTADCAVLDAITMHLKGKVYADKGYIGKNLFETLWQRGLHLITGIRKTMKNYLVLLLDKLMLPKRFIIEPFWIHSSPIWALSIPAKDHPSTPWFISFRVLPHMPSDQTNLPFLSPIQVSYP